MSLCLFGPSGVSEDHARWVAAVENRAELSTEKRMQRARLSRYRPLRRLNLDLGVGQQVEQIALVRARQYVSVRAPSHRVATCIYEGNQVAALGLGEHSDEVPAFLPIDL